MLALGTLLERGVLVWLRRHFSAVSPEAGTFAIAGMGALLAASVRAANGIVLGAGDDR